MFVEDAIGPSNQRTDGHSLPQSSAPPPGPAWYPWAKAVGDFVLALGLLVLTAPLLMLAALAIKLTSPGPAFYSQMRLGRAGRPYIIYKLRTIIHNHNHHTRQCWSVLGHPRVTPLSRFRRRTRLTD